MSLLFKIAVVAFVLTGVFVGSLELAMTEAKAGRKLRSLFSLVPALLVVFGIIIAIIMALVK